MNAVAVVLSDSEDEGELHSEESHSDDISSEEGEIQSDIDDNDLDEEGAPPTEETPWERGLRLARERLRRAKLLRQTEEDLEEKKLKLAVVAPEANDEDLSAVDNERLNFTDPLWSNYYKLAIIGRTQLTGKRTLPCDLDPPTESKITHWRRSLVPVGARRGALVHTHRSASLSSTDHESSILSDAGEQSRSSSLSSIAGSILLAVPELAADDESDRDVRRRRSSASSTSSSSPDSSSSSRGGVRQQQRKASSRRKKRFASSSASRSSSSSSSSYSRHRSRSPKARAGGRSSANVSKQFANSSGVPSRGRRPLAYLENQRQQPTVAPSQPSSLLEERGEEKGAPRRFPYPSGDRNDETRNVGTDPRWSQRPSNLDSRNLQENRSPGKPAPGFSHNEKSVSTSWGLGPSNKTKSTLSSSSQQTSRSNKQGAPPTTITGSPSLTEEKTTFITSWSQASSPNEEDEHQRHRSSKSRRQVLPDVVPNSASAGSNKRGPSDQRRKSRSPFADTVYGGAKTPGTRGYGKNKKPQALQESVLHPPFEQTVPLLAGAVNPGNPSAMLPGSVASGDTEKAVLADRPMNELPAASARPGVKLKIAPRLKVPVLQPGSGLGKSLSRHCGNSEYQSPSSNHSQNRNAKQRYNPREERLLALRQPQQTFKRSAPRISFDSGGQSSESSSRSTSSSPRSGSRSPQTDSSLSEHMPEQITNRHRQLAQDAYVQSRPVSKKIRTRYTTVSPDEFSFPPTQAGRENRMDVQLEQQFEEPTNYKTKRAYQKDERNFSRRQQEMGSQPYETKDRGRRGADYAPDRVPQFAESREDVFAPNVPSENADQYAERRSRNDRNSRHNTEDQRFRATSGLVCRGIDQPAYKERVAKDSRTRSGHDASLYQSSSPLEPDFIRAAVPARSRTRVGRAERSRSPFESLHREDAAATELRLNELRQRLTVVDDAIAELKGNPAARSNAGATFR